MKQELIGRGTQDYGCATLIEEAFCLRSEGEAMNEDCAAIENLKVVERENLVDAIVVYTFGGVKNEWVVGCG